jgi:hypothetical protein
MASLESVFDKGGGRRLIVRTVRQAGSADVSAIVFQRHQPASRTLE